VVEWDLAQWDHPVGLSCTTVLPDIGAARHRPYSVPRDQLAKGSTQQPPIPSSVRHRHPHASRGGRYVGTARDLGAPLEPAQVVRVGHARLWASANFQQHQSLARLLKVRPQKQATPEKSVWERGQVGERGQKGRLSAGRGVYAQGEGEGWESIINMML